MKIFERNGRLHVPETPPWLTDRRISIKNGHPFVKHLYCQHGHPLIDDDNTLFEQHPGIELLCEGANITQMVVISPFLGDTAKHFDTDFKQGELITIRCPMCMNELPTLSPHDCHPGAHYVSLFLTEKAHPNNSIGICNAWGCYSSVLQPYGEIISKIRRDSVIPEG